MRFVQLFFQKLCFVPTLIGFNRTFPLSTGDSRKVHFFANLETHSLIHWPKTFGIIDINLDWLVQTKTYLRTLKRLQMNDIRVGMSFERIAAGLDCLNLQHLKIFSQISVMSGKLQ